MEDTASHETVYKLAHRADKANFPSDSLIALLVIPILTGARRYRSFFNLTSSSIERVMYNIRGI